MINNFENMMCHQFCVTVFFFFENLSRLACSLSEQSWVRLDLNRIKKKTRNLPAAGDKISAPSKKLGHSWNWTSLAHNNFHSLKINNADKFSMVPHLEVDFSRYYNFCKKKYFGSIRRRLIKYLTFYLTSSLQQQNDGFICLLFLK